MKNHVPQFVIRYANNKIDRVMKESETGFYSRVKKINYAVCDFEYGEISLDECMLIIAQA